MVGPKVQGGVEGFEQHLLLCHAEAKSFELIRTFEGIKEFFEDKDIEGLVFHNKDGRMAKIKKSDFGMKRKQIKKKAYGEEGNRLGNFKNLI